MTPCCTWLAGKRARADHRLAPAVKLRPLLRLDDASSPAERDRARGFVLQAIAQTMTALAGDKRP